MNITNIGIKMINGGSERLKAFCTITIDDDFVVRDLKVVDGPHGLFVAMPSRKRTTRCGRCSHRNEVRSSYCNDCGAEMPPLRADHPTDGRNSDHTDIAHPINSECREMIQRMVLEAYHAEADAIRRAEEEAARRAEEEAARRAEEVARRADEEAARRTEDETIRRIDQGEARGVRVTAPREAREAAVRIAPATAPAPPVPALDDNEAFGAGIT